MKRLLVILLTICTIFSFSACNRDDDTPSPSAPAYTTSLPEAEGVTNFVQFTMNNGATFVVELYPQLAPITVANFKTLVSQKYYDGLTFHRICKDLIQGGDIDGDGLSSPNQPYITGEFASNGCTYNTISHKRGVISMARTTNPDSAYSQFFIMQEDHPSFDGSYAAFGCVVAGIETIDELTNVEVTTQKYSSEKSKPVTPPVMTSVYFVNYVPQGSE